MRFLLYEDLRMQKGIPYSNRQLKRLEERGHFLGAFHSLSGGQSEVGPRL